MLKIEIYKDIVVIVICALWLLGNTVEFLLTRSMYVNNIEFIAIVSILILIKDKNEKFNNWLNTKINK